MFPIVRFWENMTNYIIDNPSFIQCKNCFFFKKKNLFTKRKYPLKRLFKISTFNTLSLKTIK